MEKLINFLNQLQTAFPVPVGVNNHCICLMVDDRVGYRGAPNKLTLQLFLPDGSRKCFFFEGDEFTRDPSQVINELKTYLRSIGESV